MKNNPKMMNDLLSKKIIEFEKSYKKTKLPLEFDFKSFVSSNLSIKRSDVYTHNIHPYPGRLFPYIPIFFLSSDKLCPSEGKVLDIFSGSGTVLLESIINPFHKRNVFGIEINPLGRLISKVKTTPINPNKLDKTINNLNKKLKKLTFIDYKKNIPNFINIDIWFSKKAKKGLAKIKTAIEEFEDDDCKDFLWICFSRLVRMVSKADPYIPPPVLLKIEKYKDSYRFNTLKEFIRQNENPDIETILDSVLTDNYRRVRKLWDIKEIKSRRVVSKIIWDDARNIKLGHYNIKGLINKNKSKQFDNSVSLILTSPPYLAAQKYIRTTKLELYWLGTASEAELNRIKKETIGDENVSLLNKVYQFNIPAIDLIIDLLKNKSKDRMLLVSEYFKNMKDVFRQCYKALVGKGYMILVVGDNQIGDMKINTAELLSVLARKNGFEVIFVLSDQIRRRGMITKRHDSGGLIKDEFIIVLRKI